MLCASAQKQYPNEAVLYIDAEHAVSVDYFRKLGVDFDTDLMYFIQPDSGEEAIDIINNAVEAGFFSLIIVDSIPALVSKAEFASDAEDVVIAPMAKLLARALKRINSQSSKNTLTVFINQTRETIGFGGASTPGGKAVKFFPSLRIEMKRTGLLTKGDVNIGHTIKYNLVKNRFGAPYSKTDVNLYYGKGINKKEELVDLLLDKSTGLSKRGGAWYTITSINDEPVKLMGGDNIKDYIFSSPEITAHFEAQVENYLANMGKNKEEVEETDTEPNEDE